MDDVPLFCHLTHHRSLLETLEDPSHDVRKGYIHNVKERRADEYRDDHDDRCAVHLFPGRPGGLLELQPDIGKELLEFLVPVHVISRMF